MKLHEKLMNIQFELKAKKGQYNSFGKYNYRSLEDVCEALKPLLKEQKCVLIINNELHEFTGKLFRKSIAILQDCESEEKLEVSTYTQEALDKKGMAPEQCSGSSASYSDKYVLNKMFLIDDTKDADSMDNSKKQPSKEVNPAEYVLKIGQNKGEKLSNVAKETLENLANWLNEQPKVNALGKETIAAINNYLNEGK